jgi:hypothetical protein
MEKKVTKQELELFATKIASNYIKDKIPLNESIKKIASDEEYLTAEHLKRLVEMSNSKVYQHMYDNGEKKNIEFDVANPNEIVKEIQTEPVKIAFNMSIYNLSPKYKEPKMITKQASSLEEDLKEEKFKSNSSHIKHDIKRTKEQLNSAKEELESKKLSYTMKVADQYKQLFNETKEMLHEISFNKIANAIYLAAPSLLERLTIDLLDNALINNNDLEISKAANILNEDDSYIKLAKRIQIDLDHCDIYDFAIKEAQNNLDLLKEIN